MAATFHHFGVPTDVEVEGATHIEGAGVFISDPEASPYRIEFLRFASDSPMPEAIQTERHAAFMVDSVDEAIAGKEIVLPPTAVSDSLTVAFIRDGNALIEVME